MIKVEIFIVDVCEKFHVVFRSWKVDLEASFIFLKKGLLFSEQMENIPNIAQVL